jgi:hypothetical protein
MICQGRFSVGSDVHFMCLSSLVRLDVGARRLMCAPGYLQEVG